MQLAVHDANRWLITAGEIPPVPTIIRDLFSENGIEGDFAVMHTIGMHAFEQTRFKAYSAGNELLVAIHPAGMADAFAPGDSVEIFFDPFHDHLGYCQFCFTRADVQTFTHLPYSEAHSSAFPWPKLLSCEWVDFATTDMMGLPAKTPLLVARFALESIFRQGNCCGFNVARNSGRMREPSVWNKLTGNLLQDASGFGHLYSGSAPAAASVTRVELDGETLRLAGELSEGGALTMELADPHGNRQPISLTITGSTWQGATGIDPALLGRYRLYPSVAGEAVEPSFLFFDLVGKARPFLQCITYDSPDDFCANYYTPERLRQQMTQIQGCGVSRLYWIDYPDFDDYPAFWIWASNEQYCRETFKQCGNLVETAARTSKALGMEFYGVFKPFDMGSSIWMETAPAHPESWVKGADGRYAAAWPPIVRHPEWTMQAHPEWTTPASYPITRIRLYSEEPIAGIDPASLTLWISENNKDFTRYDGPLTMQCGTVKRPHARWTPAGKAQEPGTNTNWVLDLADMQVNHPFLALKVNSEPLRFTHRQFMLAETTGQSGREVAVTLGSGSLERGFDFSARWNWANYTEQVVDTFTWAGKELGLSFAVPDRLSMMLEPTFPQVRQLFLGQVERILKSPADGVDIRTYCHHNTCHSWLTYAFAEPVRDEFRTRYGREVQATAEDYARIRRIRGEAYTEFIRDASMLTRQYGKRFAVHLEPGCEVPAENDVRMAMTIEWEKWLDEGLVDEITLKYWCNQSSFVHERVLPRARKAGIPVIPCDRNFSLMSPRAEELARHLLLDAYRCGLAGYNFYEVCSSFFMNAEGVSWPIGSVDHAMRDAWNAVEACR